MSVAVRRLSPVRSSMGFLGALGAFLRTPTAPDECLARLTAGLADRGNALVAVLREALDDASRSPYRRLSEHAGLRMADVEELVRVEGPEGALARLHELGVYVRLEEFKGQRPIQRGSLRFDVTAADFDNRSLGAAFSGRTGGSRSAGRELLIDLDLIAQEACHDWLTAKSLGVVDASWAQWRPVPPATAGLKLLLRRAKIGRRLARWFSQTPLWERREWRHALFTASVVRASRWTAQALAWPEHVPTADAARISQWLARERQAGRNAVLATNAASAVRVCHAALSEGHDISGSVFLVGGEPYSEGKAAAVAQAGCLAAVNYSMSEIGRIAAACGDPSALDDAHVAMDKVVLLQRDVSVGSQGATLPGLFLTGIHPSTPKVMINVELGDYATIETRPCGCQWNTLGFTQHITGIRSYEKLTAEGMHFVGADLLTLIEQTMPATFGGTSLDYQLVERERNGLPVVSLVVSPQVGELDPDRARDQVLRELGRANAAARMMATRWRDADTLQIERREPYTTSAGKVLALHVAQGEPS